MKEAASFNLYRDIAERTDGDVYIGVVGPVRTGKSTFIARFMEELVLPRLPSGPRRDRLADELPQSGSGRTIMTTQPKFVPGEAVQVMLQEQTPVRIRLVDSVGYLVKGALGTSENDAARMVHTPWFDQDIPFDQAAEIGTRKVMTDHATIGMVVTTDGSITDLPRSAYVEAEERVVSELKALGKPFVMLLNSASPRQADTLALRDSLEDKYAVPVMLLNVKEMSVEDIQHVLESVLMEFPLREARLNVPAWLGALDNDHWLVKHILEGVRLAGVTPRKMRETDVFDEAFADSEYTGGVRTDQVSPGEGRMDFNLPLKDGLFNRILGEECGTEIRGDAHLLALMKELVSAKTEYDRVADALRAVRETGYGLVTPSISEMTLQQPEIVKQGGRFGVKLKAQAPSLHMIRVDIETEVTPVVGTEQQSEELVKYLLEEFESDPQKIWSTNFFGKSLSDMVREGLNNKLMQMPADTQEKVQEMLTRIINEGSGGMICILL
ncbi:MAG: stage IV sporulation protein A [Eubacteriales bacterium]|nr:stage IV sporulation protein A [Eubacteriales bacterium]